MTTDLESSRWKDAASRVFATVPRSCAADAAKATCPQVNAVTLAPSAGMGARRGRSGAPDPVRQLWRWLILAYCSLNGLSQSPQTVGRPPACVALRQVSFRLYGGLGRQLTVDVQVQNFSEVFAIHHGFLRTNSCGWFSEVFASP